MVRRSMARPQLPPAPLLAVLLLVAYARQAATAATPTRRLTQQAVEVNNHAPRPAVLPPGLRNATWGQAPGSSVKVTQTGLTIRETRVISPLVPTDGFTQGFDLTIPGGPSCTIADMDVTVQWVKCDAGITPAGTCTGNGAAGSDEIFLDVRNSEAEGFFITDLVQELTYGTGPTPGASFTVTFDDQAVAQVGRNPDGSIANGGNPEDGTFRPADFDQRPLSTFNGLEARGRTFLLVYNAANIPTGRPFALQSWQIDITCGEPTCDDANFIGYGSGTFWGPKTLPGTDTLVTQNDPVTGGWPDGCAKAFDACQASTSDPAVFDNTCGCTLWTCLNPCFANECPVTGQGPICPPQDLRTFYCHALKGAHAMCGDDAPPFPDDCESSAPAGAANMRARRNRA